MSEAPPNLQGDELLRDLRQGWASLPTKTLFALALGGLRVRMMRSMVTMLSIVLAIAFLTYTGISMHLTRDLALAVRAFEDRKPVEPEQIAAAAAVLEDADLISAMPIDAQVSFARQLGLTDMTGLEMRMRQLRLELLDAEAAVKSAEAERERIEDDPAAIDTDKQLAAEIAEAAGAELTALRQELADLEAAAELSGWINRRDANAAEAQRLDAALTARLLEEQRTLFANLRRPHRYSNAELAMTLDLLATAPADEHIDTAIAALEQERDKRTNVVLMRKLTSQAVNIDKTIAGDPMDYWIIAMALLTCAVGIANAMLMSVTERFREIGTMKCLGAQDSLVVKLFLVESGVLGIVGAAIGIVVGIVVAVAAAAVVFGGTGLSYFPMGDSVLVIIYSIIGGMILAVVGAVGPAISAARMKPVDALRVDE